MEHFSSSFSITSSYNWRMYSDETSFVKKLMNSERKQTSYSEYCRKRVCSWSEVGDSSEIFKRVSLFLERKCFICCSQKSYFCSFEFKSLFCSFGFYEISFNLKTAPCSVSYDFIEIFKFLFKNDLKIF